MTDLPIGSSMDDMREIIAEQIKMLDGNYDGDTVGYYKPNNIQHKKKQIAKRRARNKNKKR